MEFFTSKLIFLQDFHKQLLWNSNQDCSFVGISNTIEYFRKLMFGILRNSSKQGECKFAQCNFPDLDYYELCDILLLLLNKLIHVHSDQEDIIFSILDCLSLAMLFGDEFTRIDFPATIARILYELGDSNNRIQEEILKYLFHNFIPMCFGPLFEDNTSLKCYDEIPILITVVLECVQNVAFHYQLIETIMLFKKDLWVDIMTVVYLSDGKVKVFAVQLLFHYWPQLNPTTSEIHKLDLKHVFQNISCENTHCNSPCKTNAAVVMLLDPILATKLTEKSPPLYLCHFCAQNITYGRDIVSFHDVLLPMEAIGSNCQNKYCVSKDNIAKVMLCSSQCERKFSTNKNNSMLSENSNRNFFWHILENRSIRYCSECFHNVQLMLGDLMTQTSPNYAWNLLDENKTEIIVSTVISLLLEPVNIEATNGLSKSPENQNVVCGVYPCIECKENVGQFMESKSLSQFGVWLLVTLCPPSEKISQKNATRLIATVLSWYGSHSKLDSDESGSRLENLKQQYLEQWLKKMASLYFKVFLNVLLPHPNSESKTKGHWDTIKPLWRHYQDALSLLTCLSTYSIINKEMWDCLIPSWMLALSTNLSTSELQQLKTVLNVLLDVDLSPLPFNSAVTFDFLLRHFKQPILWHQEQALLWLQTLSDVDVVIPLGTLLDTFNTADTYIAYQPCKKEKNENKFMLLFGDSKLIDELKAEEIYKQSIHPNVRSLQTVFELMNVSCTKQCCQESYSNEGNKTSKDNNEERRHSYATRILLCYVQIFDVVHRQMMLQSEPQQGGFCQGEAAKIVKLLNTLLNHVSVIIEKQNRENEIEDFELVNTVKKFFKLFMVILSYILPQADHEQVILNGDRHWSIADFKKQSNNDFTKYQPNIADFESFCFPVQLVFKLVKILHDLDHRVFVIDDITRCISMLCLNGKVLKVISNITQPVINRFQRYLFFPILWKLLCHMDKACYIVPVIMQGIAISETAFLSVMSLLNDSFNKFEALASTSEVDSWSYQFTAIHQIQALLMFTDASLVRSRSALSHVIAYAISLVLETLDKPNAAMSTKAMFVLNALSVDNLQVACTCLQHEFDESVKDRVFILSELLLLHNLRPDCSALSFSFFSHCMDVLAAESAIHSHLNKPFPFPSSACSQKSLLQDEELSVKVARARCSLYDSVTLRDRIAQCKIHMEFFSVDKCQGSTLISEKIEESTKSFLQADTPVRECCMMESPLDSDTVHHLMFVVCKFLNNVDLTPEKSSKMKSFRTFSRQLHTMLGYNDQISYFTSAPKVLRSSVGVKSLLVNLPLIIDYNQRYASMSMTMLLSFLERIVSTRSTIGVVGSTHNAMSLDTLPSNIQLSWLQTLIVVMYKYQPNDLVDNKILIPMILACLDTLELHFHHCLPGESCIEMLSISDNKSSPISDTTIFSRKRLATFHQDLTRDKSPSEIRCNTFNSREEQNIETPLLRSLPRAPSSTQNGSTEETTFLINTLTESNCQTTRTDSSLDAAQFRADTKTPFTKVFDQGEMQSPAEERKKQQAKKEFKVQSRCGRCKKVLCEFNDETINLCIISLCEIVRFCPKSAVPLLPRILKQLAVIAEPLLDEQTYLLHVVSKNVSSLVHVAKQAIRCIFHQLLENNIFSCLFLVPFVKGDTFIPVILTCLKGYHKVHSIDVLGHTLEGLPDDLSSIQFKGLNCLLANIATYLRHLPPYATASQWHSVLNIFCAFFLKLHNYITNYKMQSIEDVLEIMIHLLKVPICINLKQSLLDPCGKILSVAVPNWSYSLSNLYQLCSVANEVFNKDKDKLFFTRCVVSKLMAALKGSCPMSDRNLQLLLQMVLVDGGSINTTSELKVRKVKVPCYAMECFHAHLNDCLDILAGGDFLCNQTDNPSTAPQDSVLVKGSMKPVHSADVKLSVAQIVAGELHNKPVAVFFPWLFNPPSTIQHGVKEYSECVMHVRKLSWILLGALHHLALIQSTSGVIWQPVPFESGPNLASILQVILTGYLEQKQEQVLNTGALFYAFIFCQIWTVYCEQISYFLTPNVTLPGGSATNSCQPNVCYNPTGEPHVCVTLLLEFWSRVTPSMLVLLEQDGKVSEKIHRHIASLISCLEMYDSNILLKLYPMWSPMLEGLKAKLSKKPKIKTGDDCTENLETANSNQLLDVVESIKWRLQNIETDEGMYVV